MTPAAPSVFELACMRRAAYLATTAVGTTSPNPKVGAVIAHGGRVLSEGLFRVDGGPHAEVDALSRLPVESRALLPEATVYVTLEPCSIFGRTPPCADRLLAEGVGKVVVGALDATPGVCGEGLRTLRAGGVVVAFGLGQDICFELARPRNVFAAQGRPYVILKQAVSADGFVGREGRPVPITCDMANLISHGWRAESDAILIGSRTFATDAPSLTTRLVAGKSPDVVVLDTGGRLSPKLVAAHFTGGDTPPRRLFYASAKPVAAADATADVETIPLTGNAIENLLSSLCSRRVGRLLVEGGPATLRVFAEAGLWDEYREWTSPQRLAPGQGRAVPAFRPAGLLQSERGIGCDTLRIYTRGPR